MGATNSVNNILSDNIYVSCLEKDEHAELLCSYLRKQGYNVIKFPITELDVECITKNINKILTESICILVCIRERTMRSFHQIIEINSILDSSKKIIYLMTEEGFTPNTNIDIKRFIQTNKWFPAYDQNSVHYSLSEINTLVHQLIH